MPMNMSSSLSQAVRASILRSSTVLVPPQYAGLADNLSFIQDGTVTDGRLRGYKNKFSNGQEMTTQYNYSPSTGRVESFDLLTTSGQTIRLTPTYDAGGDLTGLSPSFV